MTETDPRLRRRDLLRTGAAAVSLPLVGAATAGSREQATDRARTAAPPATFEPLGSADVNGAKEAVVGPDGDNVFVATGTGFVTVDVSDPTDPNIAQAEQNLSDDAGDDLVQVWDVKYDAGQLLVASAAQAAPPRGFYLYDVSDPTAPTRVGDWFATPDHGIHNCDLHDGVAYLTGNASDGRKVVAVDVSEPPFETLGTWQPGDWDDAWADPPNTSIHDVYAHGDYVYAAYWDAGTFVLDKSDPANMTFVSRVGDYGIEELREIESRRTYLEPPGNDHYVTVDEDAQIMAEGGESWDIENDGSGGPSGITIYDISDKSDPQRLAHVDAPASDNNSLRSGATETTSHNFDIHGDRLYASWYQGGVTIHDISDPTNPERIAWWADTDERSFWTAQLAVEDGFFVASSFGGDYREELLTFPDDAGGRMASPPNNVEWAAPGSYPEAGGGETTTPSDGTTTAPPATSTQRPATTTAPAEGSTQRPATTTAPAEGSTQRPATTTAVGSTPGDTAAPTTEVTPDGTDGDGTTASDDDSSGGGSPGPGLLGALAGVAGGVAWLRRRRGDDAE
mgnify:CR=1 FL=1